MPELGKMHLTFFGEVLGKEVFPYKAITKTHTYYEFNVTIQTGTPIS